MKTESVCQVCHRPEEGHNARHPFIGPGDALNSEFFAKKENDSLISPSGNMSGPVVQSSHMPIDPVLRTALINKGILTMQDLEEADAFIRAVGGALNGNQEPK